MCPYFCRSCGKRITSRIAGVPLRIISNRSMPMHKPTGRRHAVLQRGEEVLIQLAVAFGFVADLPFHPRALHYWVVQLAESCSPPSIVAKNSSKR